MAIRRRPLLISQHCNIFRWQIPVTKAVISAKIPDAIIVYLLEEVLRKTSTNEVMKAEEDLEELLEEASSANDENKITHSLALKGLPREAELKHYMIHACRNKDKEITLLKFRQLQCENNLTVIYEMLWLVMQYLQSSPEKKKY
ncbi:hypothetical protein CEXT_299251 [Caerostris extrusa]|uniref:Uncharacterized protein n=1 Tax=Caerostris extrusa TaxID=172846 RepID=A0AAV4WLU9_CAEEX|nr:hypothetical protein CEXT_299251 [Caerostris extrusa]